MRPLIHLDTFSGICGFALAAHWAGFETIGFCEIEAFPQAIIRKHYPGKPICNDIRQLTVGLVREWGIGHVDLLTGGFPCQDISAANPNGAGIDGERSGLWFELLRVINEVLPGWVVIENSPLLRIRGADIVLQGLEIAGYTRWPLVVGADDAGAPHERKRTLIVAHSNRVSFASRAERTRWEARTDISGRGARAGVADTIGSRSVGWGQWQGHGSCDGRGNEAIGCDTASSTSGHGGLLRRGAGSPGLGGTANGLPERLDFVGWPSRPGEAQFSYEAPRTGKPKEKIPDRAARLKALGNAVVPQVVYPILQAIADIENGTAAMEAA